MDFTREQILDIYKSYDDPQYFMENFCRLRGPVQPSYLFLNPQQTQWLSEIKSGQNHVELGSARQTGRTTFSIAYALHRAMFHHHARILMLGYNSRYCQFSRMLASDMHAGMPDHIRCKVTVNNSTSMEFENGSKIFFKPADENAGRGLSLNLVIFDGLELLEPEKSWRINAAILPTLVYPQGLVLFTS